MNIRQTPDEFLQRKENAAREQSERALQPMVQEGSQAQKWLQNGGLQDAFPNDETPGIGWQKIKDGWKNAVDAERGKRAARRQRLYQAFSGDPLAAVPGGIENRSKVEARIASSENIDAERKKVALAYYFSKNDPKNIGFVYENIDQFCEEFAGGKATPEQVYDEIAAVVAYQKDLPEDFATYQKWREQRDKTTGFWNSLGGMIGIIPYGFTQYLSNVATAIVTEKNNETQEDGRTNLSHLQEEQWRALQPELHRNTVEWEAEKNRVRREYYRLDAPALETGFGQVPNKPNRLGVYDLPALPGFDTSELSEAASARNKEAEDAWLAVIKRNRDKYPWAQSAKSAAEVQEAYWNEIERRYKEATGGIDTSAGYEELQRKLRVIDARRSGEYERLAAKLNVKEEMEDRIRTVHQTLEDGIREQQQKYHPGNLDEDTVAGFWGEGSYGKVAGKSLAIIWDQIALSILPMMATHFAFGEGASTAVFAGAMEGEGYNEADDANLSPEMKLEYARWHAAYEVIPEVIFGWIPILHKMTPAGRGAVREALPNAAKDYFKSFVKGGTSDTFGELLTFCFEKAEDAALGIGLPDGKTSWDDLTGDEKRQFLTSGLVETIIGSLFTAGLGEAWARRGERGDIKAFNLQGERWIQVIEARVAELREKETLEEAEASELRELETVLDNGNFGDFVRVVQREALREAIHTIEKRKEKPAGTTEEAGAAESPEAAPETGAKTSEDAEEGELEASDRRARELKLKRDLPHNPDDTAAAVDEWKKKFPNIKIEIVTEWTPEQLRILRQRGVLYPEKATGQYDGKTDTVILNVSNLRPSEVPFKILHEVGLHAGIRRAFGNDAANNLFRAVFEATQDTDLMRQIIEAYKLRSPLLDENGEAIYNSDGELEYDDMTDAQKCEAAEEYLAFTAETYGVSAEDIFRDNRVEIVAWGRKQGRDVHDLADRRSLTLDWMNETGFKPERPGWWKRLISQIRVWLAQNGFGHLRDADIETIIQKAAKAARERKAVHPDRASRFALIGSLGAVSNLSRENPKRDINFENLERASRMLDHGYPVKQIWLETGWVPGADGQLRMEIPDLRVKTGELTQDGNYNALIDYDGPLDGYIDAPEIFEAYPELKSTKLRFIPLPLDTSGYYSEKNKLIAFNKTLLARRGFDALNDMAADMKEAKTQREADIIQANIQEELGTFTEGIRNTLIHEVQHAIQHIEGFAKGTSPEEAVKMPDTEDPLYNRIQAGIPELEEKYKDVQDRLRAESERIEWTSELENAVMFYYLHDHENDLEIIRNELADNPNRDSFIELLKEQKKLARKREDAYAELEISRSGMSRYKRSAGEVEARNAEQRAAMSDERRRETMPSETEDELRENQIVRFSLMENAEKRDVIIPALQRIAEGSDEEVLRGIRNDLEQYGGTNDITLVWGNEKKGIYHIAYKRGMNTLMRVLDAVSDGELTKYVAGNKTVHLVKDGFEAILSLDEYGKKKTWLLTGWEIDKPDAVGEFYTNSDATQNTPTFSRRDLGAGLKNIIAQFQENASGNGEKTRYSTSIDTPQFKRWFKDSKVVDKDGKPLVVYHGTNWDMFAEKPGDAVFSDRYIGTSSGDNGFYGRGFYFTFGNEELSEHEAGYYGRKVYPFYLSIQKPFYFLETLCSWKGKRILDFDVANSVELVNAAKLFPELLDDIKLNTYNEKEDSVGEISVPEYADMFNKVYREKKFEFRKDEANDELIIECDPIEYSENGDKWTEYGFSTRTTIPKDDTDLQLIATHYYLEQGSEVTVDNSDSVLHDFYGTKEFRSWLEKQGYDGVMQSKIGDEVVAFRPEQIKSVDNVGTFDPNNPDIRYSVSPVWTGSAADYEQPSLHYVGTGEGKQVYGWGLYGSSEEEVARWYAKTDVRRKGKHLTPWEYAHNLVRAAVTMKGGRVLDDVDVFRSSEDMTDTENAWEDIVYELDDYVEHKIQMDFSGTISAEDLRKAAIKKIQWRIKMWNDDNHPTVIGFKNCLSYLQDEDKKGEIEFRDIEVKRQTGRNLYKQTFWPDKEENLLDWDESITEEQIKQIDDALSREEDEPLFYSYAVVPTGEKVYARLSHLKGSPRAASEFLYRAGIDGVTYIGDSSGVRNYVAFSDQDIRVDEHIRFALDIDGNEDLRAYIEVLKPYVPSDAKEHDGAYYAGILKEKAGVEISPETAMGLAEEAVRERRKAKNKKDWKDAYSYFSSANPLFDYVVNSEMVETIRPSHRFEGEDFSGSYISPEFVEYSEKKQRSEYKTERGWRNYLRRREEALARAKGAHSDELAKGYVLEHGGDELDVEQQIIDLFRDLKRPDIRSAYSKFKQENFARDIMEQHEYEELMEEMHQREIEDSVISVMSAGQPVVTDDWVAENREVYKELYKQIIGQEAPYSPSKADMEAINAALVQEDTDVSTYAKIYKAARAASQKEALDKVSELRRSIVEGKENAVKLQKAANMLLKSFGLEGDRRFTGRILELMNYQTAARRQKAFDNLMEQIKQAGSFKKKMDLFNRIGERLQQLGRRADTGRKAVGVRDEETQVQIDKIREIAQMSPAEIYERQGELQEAINAATENGDSPVLFEEEMALLGKYGDLINKSAAELTVALSDLNDLAVTGKRKILAALQERAGQDRARINEAIDLINHGEFAYGIERERLENKRNKERRSMKNHALYDLFDSFNLWGKLTALNLASEKDIRETVFYRMQELTHKCARNKDTLNEKHQTDTINAIDKFFGTKGAFQRAAKLNELRKVEKKTGVFRRYLDESGKEFEYSRLSVDEAREMLKDYDRAVAAGARPALEEYAAEAIRHQLRMHERKLDLKKVEFIDGVTEKIMKAANEEGKDADRPIVIPRPKLGGAQEMELSQMQALYQYLMWQQKNTRYKMFFRGWTQESIDQLETFMLPEVKRFGDWMAAQLDADRKDIDPVYQKLYMTAFPHEEHYFPAVYDNPGVNNRLGSPAGVDLNQAGAGAAPVQYNPGALKMRVFHLGELRLCDALTVFENHRMIMTHFVTHGEAAREIRALFANKDVRRAIEEKHGEKRYQSLTDDIKDFINGGRTVIDRDRVFGKFYSAAVRSKMMINVTSGVKQTLGALTYMQDVPAKEFVSGVSYAMAHPKEVWETLGGTDYFKNRWRSGANYELRMLLDQAGTETGKMNIIMAKADTISSIPLRLGDAGAVLFGGYAVYRYQYQQGIKRGMSEADAKARALLEWEMSTERTQQSNQVHMQNKLQKGTALDRIFTTYLSNQILMWNHYAPRFYKQDWKNGARGMLAMAITSVAMTTANQLFRNGIWVDDWEFWDYFWDFFSDVLSGGGSLGVAAKRSIEATRAYNGGGNVLENDLAKTFRAAKNLPGDISDGESEEIFKDALDLLTAAGFFYQPILPAAAGVREAKKLYKTAQTFNREDE